MYTFLDILITQILPKLQQFEGFKNSKFINEKTLSFHIKDNFVFPLIESNFERFQNLPSLNINLPYWKVSILSILFTFNSSITSNFFIVHLFTSILSANKFILLIKFPIDEFSSTGSNDSIFPFIFFCN